MLSSKMFVFFDLKLQEDLACRVKVQPLKRVGLPSVHAFQKIHDDPSGRGNPTLLNLKGVHRGSLVELNIITVCGAIQ